MFIETIGSIIHVAIEQDGVIVSRTTIAPGDDYSSQPPEVQAACAKVHTPDVVAAYQAKIAEYQLPPPAPQPDWDGLNMAIMGDAAFNAAYGAVMQSHPLIAAALPAALTQVATGQTNMFGIAFLQMCAVAEVSPQQRESWAQIAEAHQAPPDFIKIVRGVINGE